MQSSRRLWFTAAAVVALVAGGATPQAGAVQLSQAEIIIEINATDKNARIQIFLDSED